MTEKKKLNLNRVPIPKQEPLVRRANFNEVALGYKIQKYTSDASRDYGVVINPEKSGKVIFDKSDKIVVLAED